MKLSFSISSKSSSSRSKPPRSQHGGAVALGEDGEGRSSPPKHQYVTVFDPSEAPPAENSKPVILPLENTNQWRAGKRMKAFVPPSDDTDPSAEGGTRFVVDHLGTDNPSTNTTYGLNIRSKGGDGADAGKAENLGEGPFPDDRSEAMMTDEQRFKVEIESLPDDRGMDEFKDVAIEDFSRALLQGYGWKEGQGIGRNSKQDVVITEPKKWAGTSGLGFNPDMPSSEKKDKEKTLHEEKPHLSPVRSNGFDRKKVVRIISGKHAGSKGEISKTSDKEMIALRLLSTGERVKVGADMIAELGSAEEEKCLRRLKDLDLRDGYGRRDDGRKEKRSRDCERSSVKVESKRENGGHRSSSGGRESEPVYWLRSHIKVRVISKDFKRGRLYLKKGVVTDVVGPMTCDISMDENRELLQGVDQELLETVLPQRGGPVIVLYGRHKGVYGKLMEKDREKETATVQEADSHELIKVRMEQIAEYIGDPGDIGY